MVYWYHDNVSHLLITITYYHHRITHLCKVHRYQRNEDSSHTTLKIEIKQKRWSIKLTVLNPVLIHETMSNRKLLGISARLYDNYHDWTGKLAWWTKGGQVHWPVWTDRYGPWSLLHIYLHVLFYSLHFYTLASVIYIIICLCIHKSYTSLVQRILCLRNDPGLFS